MTSFPGNHKWQFALSSHLLMFLPIIPTFSGPAQRVVRLVNKNTGCIYSAQSNWISGKQQIIWGHWLLSRKSQGRHLRQVGWSITIWKELSKAEGVNFQVWQLLWNTCVWAEPEQMKVHIADEITSKRSE